jgi:HK97 family phage major capsid protein
MLKRSIQLDRAAAKKNEGGDLVIPMAFASEEPYERWWGIEILDTSEGSIRLERLNDGANVLFNHNPNDLRGVHVKSSVRTDKDKILRGDVRITSATQSGRETIALIESDVLTKASVGYRVHKVIQQTKKKSGEKIERTLEGRVFERLLEQAADAAHTRDAFYRSLDAAAGAMDGARDADGEPDVFRVVDWEPYENSLVTIPADATVGVGRSADVNVYQPAATAAQREETSMKTEAELAAEAEAAEKARKAAAQTDPVQRAQEAVQQMSAMEMEKARRRAIENLCKANKLDDRMRDTWIAQGYSIEQVSEDILRVLEERGRTNPQPASRLGLTSGETQRFSIARAITAAAAKDWAKAGFELECSRSVAQKLGRVAEDYKFYIPFEVMERPLDVQVRQYLAGLGRRDLTVATAGAGGFLVGTENVGFIEMLRNRSVAFRMGARRLSGLQGSVTVPRQSAAATAVWLANEASTLTESQQTFVQMALSPKNVGAYTEISRQLLLQASPGAEGIVTDDLAQVTAIAADLGVLEGSGASGQPTGISGTSGIGSVSGTSLAAAGIIEFMTDIATANVTPSRPGYVTTAAVAGLLMVRPELPTTGTTRLWMGNPWDGSLFGIPAMTSNQLTAASMIFGDWPEVVVAEWGVLEVEVNPYANFQAGIIGVRAIYSMDVGVRRPFAFSRATTIT